MQQIYRLEFGDQTDAVKSVLASARTLSHPELEIRINHYNGNTVHYGVDQWFYETLLNRLESSKVATVQRSTMYTYTKRVNEEQELRRIVKDKQTTFMMKHKPAQVSVMLDVVTNFRAAFTKSEIDQVTVHPMKFSVSNEPPCSEEDYNRCPAEEVLRIRNRTSFFFATSPNLCQIQIDLTQVISNNTYSYQVEIELLHLPKSLDRDSFVTEVGNLIKRGLSIVYPNLHNVFTMTEYFNKYSNLFVIRGQPPVNIQAKHIVNGLHDYYLTNKLDGVAYSLFVHQNNVQPNQISLVLKNSSDCWVINKIDSNKRPSAVQLLRFTNCQIRVEVVPTSSCIMLHLFDLIPSNESFHRRLEHLNTFKNLLNDGCLPSMFTVTVKDFRRCDKLTDVVNMIMKDPTNFAKKNDGLVFQPNNSSLAPLKWKFPNKITIDFLFVRDDAKCNQEHTTYFIKTLNKTKDSYNHSKFPCIKARLPLDTKLLPSHTVDSLLDCTDVLVDPKRMRFFHNVEYKNLPHVKNLHNLVIECYGQPKKVNDHYELSFSPVKVRWDKTEPNGTKVAMETCIDMLYRREIFQLVKEIEEARNEQKHEEVQQRSLSQFFPRTDLVYSQKPLVNGMDRVPTVDQSNEIFRHIEEQVPTLNVLHVFGANCGSFSVCCERRDLTVVCMESTHRDVLKHNLELYRFTSQSSFIAMNSSSNQLPDIIDAFPPSACFLDFVFNSPSSTSHLTAYPYIFVRCSSNNTQSVVKPSGYSINFIHLRGGCSLVVLSRDGMRKMRDRNNDLKRNLIDTWCRSRSVLDLGSGKGGDLSKYASVAPSKLTLVEPNPKNVHELQKRLKTTNVPSATNVVTQRAEDINLETFDVVTMFFMLTFMYGSEQNLDKFVEVIDRHLSSHGMLIGTTVVGGKIRSAVKDSTVLSFPDCTVRRININDSAFDNEVEIDLFNTSTATKQLEYLVDFEVFARKLVARNIYLANVHHIDTSGMADGELLFAQSTMGFVFMKNNLGILKSIPCPVSKTNRWRVPSSMHDSFYYSLILTTVCQDAVRAFACDNVPYRFDVSRLKDPVSALKTHLDSLMSFESYCFSSVSVFDLEYFISSEEMDDSLREHLSYVSTLLRVSSVVELMQVMSMSDKMQELLQRMYRKRRSSLEYPLDHLDNYLVLGLYYIADLLKLGLHIYDVNQNLTVFHYLPVTNCPVVEIAYVNECHFEPLLSC